jgi:hypothetical protein
MVRVNFLKKAFVLVSLVLGVGTFTGCGSGSSSSPEQCQAFETCGSYTLSACCTNTQCRYLSSNGQSFPCAGTDCTAEAQTAVNWCLSQ